MGNILASMIPSLIGLAVHAISSAVQQTTTGGRQASSTSFFHPTGENPTLTAIEARYRAEQALREADQVISEAQQHAEQIRQQANREREQARTLLEQANQAAREARAQIDAMNTAKQAQEVAAGAARAEAAKLAHETEEERKRSQKIREEAEREVGAMKEEVERVRNATNEQLRSADASKELAEELARTATEGTKKAMKAKEEAERCLQKGIQPIVTPTPEQLATAKKRIQYRDDRFHLAVAGISGSGKSSLVNAFRGLRSDDPGAATVGVVEATHEMARFPDPNPNQPFVWYDVPGAGTIQCPAWQYFINYGLYVFDVILVLFDNRFTSTDVAILTESKRFNIPTFIVRSKADQHIRNIMVEMGYESEGDDEDVQKRNRLYEQAKEKFIRETSKSVKANLKDANLPDQRVYIISSQTMLSITQNKTPKKTIDEVYLLKDLFNQVYPRRVY